MESERSKVKRREFKSGTARVRAKLKLATKEGGRETLAFKIP